MNPSCMQLGVGGTSSRLSPLPHIICHICGSGHLTPAAAMIVCYTTLVTSTITAESPHMAQALHPAITSVDEKRE
jgi:hypothetical protein